MRRLLPLAVLLLLGACISLEEAPMAGNAIERDQRVLLVVYAPPSPAIWDEDSKAETAAKIVPGLGLVVKDVQDNRDLKTSKDLAQYLPAWDAAQLFQSSFTVQMQSLGMPGKLISLKDTNLPPAAAKRLNASSDVNDWQINYYLPQPSGAVGRNYSAFLELDDAVVLEVNLLPGLYTEDEITYVPTLKAVTKLLRANTLRLLWRHENTIDEKGAGKTLYDFKVKPTDLIYAWNRLMPALGNQIAGDLRKNLASAGVAMTGAGPTYNLSYSTSSSNYLPTGGGWGPAPAPPGSPAVIMPDSLPPSASPPPFVPHASTP